MNHQARRLAQSEIYAVVALGKSSAFRMPHFRGQFVLTHLNGHASTQPLMISRKANQIDLQPVVVMIRIGESHGDPATSKQADLRRRLTHKPCHAVRGPLTINALRLPSDTPMGDPALLLPFVATSEMAKHGNTLVIPHLAKPLNRVHFCAVGQPAAMRC